MSDVLKRSTLIVIVLTLALAVSLGCQKKAQEIKLDEQVPEEVPMPQVPSQIMVPEEIANKWTAVVLEVTDKDSGDKKDYTVKIGETAPVGSTGLKVTVEAFLPSFTMAGDVFTSASPELNNPAAKVRIADESGTILYNRWLFSLYPATHPFEHPKYALLLKDYVAAK